MSTKDVDDLIELRDNLGNYALAHQNRALGRRAFLDVKPTRGKVKLGKRSMLNDRALDLNASVLRTTTTGAARTVWNAAATRQRAKYLAEQIVTAYP